MQDKEKVIFQFKDDPLFITFLLPFYYKHFGGLGGLLNADKKDLEKIKGLGTAEIAQLLAATEIARRQLKEEVIGKKVSMGRKI